MLELSSVCVNYGRRRVLDQVDLAIAPREVVALVGPNGAGKTTLIRAAGGGLPLVGGTVRVGAMQLERLSTTERARQIAVVPQARNLPPAFSVYEVVLLGRTPYIGWTGHADAADHDQTRQALERTQLLSLADRPVGELSGGEQQRVLLARALAQNTPILLLDEPTTHLDLQHQSILLNLVREMSNENGKAVLMALHDLNLAGLYADRVAVLVGGRIEVLGKPAEVLTAANLALAYRSPVHVVPHPLYGTPLILPDSFRGSRTQ